MKNKTKKTEDWDDGRTIADMDVVGISKRYDLQKKSKEEREKKKATLEELDLSEKEKRAITNGLLLGYLVPVLCVILGFALTIFLIYLWINQGF